MAIEIRKIETGVDVFLNFLIYGKTGVGKTTLLGSAQDCELTSPMLLMDVEGGTMSLSGSDIDIVRPNNFEQIQEIYDFLRFENGEYKSVGIDSLTEIQQKLSMGAIIGVLDEDASYKNLAGHTPSDRYDWLSSGEQMKRFIRAFRDLAYVPDETKRIHVFFTALEKADEKMSVICPSLPGQLGLGVGASVDIMGRMSIERIELEEGKHKIGRVLTLRETVDIDGTRCLAKARVPKNSDFPREMWRPTVDKLLKEWMAERSSL